MENYDNQALNSVVFNNLSITYLKLGQYDKYLSTQLKALEFARKEDNYSYQLDIYRNLHISYRKNKDWEQAELYLQKARDLALEFGNESDLASIYISMGVFYGNYLDEVQRADAAFEKAHELIDTESNYKLSVILLHEEARLAEKRENYTLALSNYEKIMERARDNNDTKAYLSATIDYANDQLKVNRLSKVEESLQEIQTHDLDPLDFQTIVKSKSVEAQYLIRRDKLIEAYKLLSPAIAQVIERTRNSTDYQSGYWRVEPEYKQLFDVMLQLLMRLDYRQQIVKLLDQMKTINDAALYQNPLIKSSLLSEEELTRDHNITQQLDNLRKELLNTSDEEQRLDLRNRIAQLMAQKQSLQRKITKMSDRNDWSVKAAQKQLDAGSMVLHITEVDDTLYFSYITAENIRIKTISITEELRNLFEQALIQIASGNTDLFQLHRIYQALGLRDIPDSITNLTIIPDSYLYQLPMEVLPVEQPDHTYSYGSTRYLVEDYKVNYLTSLQEMILPINTGQNSYKFDFAGYGVSRFDEFSTEQLMPLPNASEEVRRIGSTLTRLDQTKLFLKEEATEEQFKKTAPKSRIIHLATHSRVSNRDPLFSSLFLNAGKNVESNNSDRSYRGQIFAYELFDLNLSNELIMMNSCESGSGPYLEGAGVMGLSRALRYAGAKSLVLNLWSVNDKLASDFAQQFYQALNNGETKSSALRTAKIDFLKRHNANPHYWGPYMLLGNDAPIVPGFWQQYRYHTIGLLMVLLLISAGLIYHRKSERVIAQ